MRALVKAESAPGLVLQDVPKPELGAEDVLINAPLEREMARVGFVYTGSAFIEVPVEEEWDPDNPPDPDVPPELEEVYAPTVLGQLISVCHRPFAILDNPLALPYRDGDYFAYFDVLPALARDEPTPVALVFRRPRPWEIDKDVTRMELPPRVEEEPASTDPGDAGGGTKDPDADGGDAR